MILYYVAHFDNNDDKVLTEMGIFERLLAFPYLVGRGVYKKGLDEYLDKGVVIREDQSD